MYKDMKCGSNFTKNVIHKIKAKIKRIILQLLRENILNIKSVDFFLFIFILTNDYRFQTLFNQYYNFYL